MAPILVDDSRTSSVGTYSPALNRELASLAQYRIARHDEYSLVRDLRFLIYDNEGDVEEEDDQEDVEKVDNDKTNNAPMVDDDGYSDDDNEALQRAIEMSMNQEIDSSDRHHSSEDLASDREPDSIRHSVDDYHDSEDEATKLDHAIALSLQAENDGWDQDNKESAKNHGESWESGQPGPSNSGRAGQSKKVDSDRDYPCTTCIKCPAFPKRQRANCFRVVQLGRRCFHYVAVSYCWSALRDNTRSYRVRVVEKDGTVTERLNRAPDEVINRAVEFAISMGIRLIWLDQECLPQDSSREQELGIQAMDLVYTQACKTIGLFESIIPSQNHLDSIMSVLDWQKPTSQGRLRFRLGSGLTADAVIQCLMEFLEMIHHDPWNKRAWILQESLSSTTHMIFNIRMAAPFFFPIYWTLQDEAPAGNVYMLTSEMDELIQASRNFLNSATRMSPRDMSSEGDAQSALFHRASKLLDSLKEMRPETKKSNNIFSLVHARGGDNVGPRFRCNAAVALSLLRSRSNHRPGDRLAILANLCNYEVRLDTVAIENNFRSLAICLFGLAYINGDLSLLVPDVYQISKVKAPIDGPSWVFPIMDVLPFVDFRQQWEACSVDFRCPNLYDFTNTGLTAPGYMWKVDRSVDLTPIQKKWRGHWETIAGFMLDSDKRETESVSEFEERYHKLEQLCNYNGSEQLFPNGTSTLPASATSLRPVATMLDQLENDPDIRKSVSRELLFAPVNENQYDRNIVCQVLFDILRHLHDIGERALANSIWNSIRTDCIYPGGLRTFQNLPDDVADVLANADLSLDPWIGLQLDHGKRRTVSQSWLIRRIMENGHIWAGHCVTPNPWAVKGLRDADTDSEQEAKGKNTQTPSDESSQSTSPPKSLLEKQLTLHMLSLVLRNNGSEGQPSSPTLNIGTMAMVANVLNASKKTPPKPQVATFDVDGPCEVFTPYDSDMEKFPRPATRSYATCWIVEQIINEDSSLDSNPQSQKNGFDGDLGMNTKKQGLENVAQAQCIDRKGKGRAAAEVDIMTGGIDAATAVKAGQLQVYGRDFRSASDPESSGKRKENQESLQSSKEPRLDSEFTQKGECNEEEDTIQETTGCQSNNHNSESVKFRVLDRVKGMWEFMETYGKQYEFV